MNYTGSNVGGDNKWKWVFGEPGIIKDWQPCIPMETQTNVSSNYFQVNMGEPCIDKEQADKDVRYLMDKLTKSGAGKREIESVMAMSDYQRNVMAKLMRGDKDEK